MSEAEPYHCPDAGPFPNSPLPAVIYRDTVPSDADAIERLFAVHGWTHAWQNGIYPFEHFHSTAHEVLGIAAGSVEVRLGGPGGVTLGLRHGDVVVIPAGVAHRNLGQSQDLLVVGAYADGLPYDLRRGKPAEATAARRSIAAVPLPSTDPLTGARGPLLRLWTTTRPE